jgi:5-aminolevulinate synthase
MMDYNNFFKHGIEKLTSEGRYRVFANIQRWAGNFPYGWHQTSEEMKKIIIWCGNDYLGMGQHPLVVKAIIDEVNRSGAGAGGTRNISGSHNSHFLLEQELADLHQKESALVFTSGYVANHGTLSTLGSLLPECIFFSDEKNHASMIHGMRHSRAERKIFRHNDVNHLEELLKKSPGKSAKIVAFESVYSMDGDMAPIEDICYVSQKYGALTFLDEVHGVGMYGKRGGGVAEKKNVAHAVDIIQGTLGKAFGLMGGYIAGSSHFVDYIRSFAPDFIFTTSLPPAIASGAVASVRHLKSSQVERDIHQKNAGYLKESLIQKNIPFLKGDSHIIPIIVGDAKKCKKLSDVLLNSHGMYAQPINYPTVSVGTERLRITPSALHTFKMIDDFVDVLVDLWSEFPLWDAA